MGKNNKKPKMVKLQIPFRSLGYNLERVQIRILADAFLALTLSPYTEDFVKNGKPIMEELYKRFNRLVECCTFRKPRTIKGDHPDNNQVKDENDRN